MFSSSFTFSEQEHRQWTPYKHAGSVKSASNRPGGFAAQAIAPEAIGISICFSRTAMSFSSTAKASETSPLLRMLPANMRKGSKSAAPIAAPS